MTALRSITERGEERRDRVGVELDGARWRVLPTTAVVRAGLGVGVELDRMRAGTLARERRRALAFEAGVRALGTRDRSRAELERQLARRGVRAPETIEAISALTDAGYLDDARFALGRAERLAARGQGNAAIEYDLEARGIAREAIRVALATLEPESERASALVQRLGSSLATARTLTRRGFSAETLEGVLGDRFAAEDSESV